jgi:chromosomal replication initiation ATPase DnaA
MGLPDAAPRQLAFALDPRENFSREDFMVGPGNATALELVESWPHWPARTLALIGPEGSGKSHLAAIWAAAAGASCLASRALDEAAVPAALSSGALVIERAGGDDDIDERALFHLLNLAQEQRAFLLITARTTPAGWPIGLPDLASRLRALPVVTLAAPDDAMLRAVLVKLFADRQLAVDDGLISFLMVRIERSFAAARSVVAALDREALRRQRPVTRALAGEILGSAAP